MDIEKILTASVDEFVEAWNNNREEMFQACYDAIGVTVVTDDPVTL